MRVSVPFLSLTVSLSAACTHTSLSLARAACWFSFLRAIPSSHFHSYSHFHSLLITSLSPHLCSSSLSYSSSPILIEYLIPTSHNHTFSSGFLSDLPNLSRKMVDLSGKGSEPEDANARNPNGASSGESPTMSEQKKTCADCGTSKTPLWRGGPAGPKSLCNACGIRSRKKKRAILGLNKGSNEEKKGKRSSNNSNNNNGSSKIGDSLKQRLMALGREVLMQRSTVERQRKKLGEEEQAAVLLMALSYGSVYA